MIANQTGNEARRNAERHSEPHSDRTGTLPQAAPLSVPYVPFQRENATVYEQKEGLKNGTLFPGLNLPFHCAVEAGALPSTALAELMALEFAIVDLGLYLDTHPEDEEAFELYTKYVALSREGRKRYIAAYGPIRQADTAKIEAYTWLRDPWPWEVSERTVK